MEILTWLKNKEFIEDRSWKQEDKDGLNFYSFGKGDYRFEIKKNWNKKYKSAPYTDVMISLFDCKGEIYSSEGFIGWLGQKHLVSFDKEITRELFDEIIKHFEI